MVGKLYLVGCGLAPDLITLRALTVAREADYVFMDSYTSRLLGDGLGELEELIGKAVEVLGRSDLEEGLTKKVLSLASVKRVALLVVGDPLVATTHSAIVVEAVKRGIDVEVVPGISIVPTALTLSGLMIYKMGRIATITYPVHEVLSEYPYNVLKDNDERGLHTLFLLEMDAEKGYYMTVPEAIEILYKLEESRREGVVSPKRLAVAVGALGDRERQRVCPGTLDELMRFDADVPHTLIVVSPKPHFMEEEALDAAKRMLCK